jgi:hypothetical protein
MTGYSLVRDGERGIIVCTLSEGYDERHARSLCQELSAAVTWSRASGPLHLVFDNRAGRTLAPATTEVIRQFVAKDASLDDRVAIIVPNSLAKGQARPQTDPNCALFLSESAAMMWLLAARPERLRA